MLVEFWYLAKVDKNIVILLSNRYYVDSKIFPECDQGHYAYPSGNEIKG